MISINDDGLGSFRSSVRARAGRVGLICFGVGISNHQRQTLGVGRPFITLQAALFIRKLHRFPALAVQKPNLVALGLAGTRRSERDVAPSGENRGEPSESWLSVSWTSCE